MTKRRTFGHVRRLNSGRYQASYVGPDGIRHNAPMTFHNNAAAVKYLSRVEIAMEDGRWADLIKQQPKTDVPEELNFMAYAERHIRVQTTTRGDLLRPSTKEKYTELLKNHLQVFHPLLLEEITTELVNDWWGEMLTSGKKTTSSKAYKLLSSVMKRAVREGKIRNSPCSILGAHNAVTGKHVRAATREEVIAISEAINPRFKEFVVVKAFAGLRFGEITELRRKDFTRFTVNEVSYYEISVQRAVTLVGGKFLVGPPKSAASIRNVAVKSDLTEIIDSYLDSMESTDPEQLVFPSANGTWLRHDVFAKAWNSAIARKGLESDISPHSLRHHAGSHFSRAGGNLAELKEWLGDSSTSAVMRYVHTTGRTHQIVESM